MKGLFERSKEMWKRLRIQELGARYIDEFILKELKKEWMEAMIKFMKHFYHWQRFRTIYDMDCFIA